MGDTSIDPGCIFVMLVRTISLAAPCRLTFLGISLQATLPLQDYVKRLAAVFVFFYAFVGGPISYQTFDPFTQVPPHA